MVCGVPAPTGTDIANISEIDRGLTHRAAVSWASPLSLLQEPPKRHHCSGRTLPIGRSGTVFRRGSSNGLIPSNALRRPRQCESQLMMRKLRFTFPSMAVSFSFLGFGEKSLTKNQSEPLSSPPPGNDWDASLLQLPLMGSRRSGVMSRLTGMRPSLAIARAKPRPRLKKKKQKSKTKQNTRCDSRATEFNLLQAHWWSCPQLSGVSGLAQRQLATPKDVGHARVKILCELKRQQNPILQTSAVYAQKHHVTVDVSPFCMFIHRGLDLRWSGLLS